MKVETLSIVFMVISMLAGVGMFVGLFLVFKLKYKMKILPFITGCLTMFVFAFILEQIMHTIVLTSKAGTAIQGNVWLYGLYGAMAAAVFEETGRFLAMKFVLKKEADNPTTGIMYGAGHGGFEAAYLLGMGMMNNLILAFMINSGQKAALYAGADAITAGQITAQLTALCTTTSWMFLVGIVERVFAIILQIGMSMFMWRGVAQKKTGFIFLTFAIHFVADFLTVIVGNYSNVFVTELIIAVCAAAAIALAVRLYKKDQSAASEPVAE